MTGMSIALTGTANVNTGRSQTMSLEQRVRAYRRSARDSFYSFYQRYGNGKVTNWRMLIAQKFNIPISEVRRILGEMEDHDVFDD
jgi:hypothetical protein